MKKLIFHSYVSLPEGTNLIFPASKKVANHKQVPGMASPSTFVIFEATDKKKLYPGWWFQPSWKYESQLGLLFPYIMEHKTCSKPPTRYNTVADDFMVLSAKNLKNSVNLH